MVKIVIHYIINIKKKETAKKETFFGPPIFIHTQQLGSADSKFAGNSRADWVVRKRSVTNESTKPYLYCPVFVTNNSEFDANS